MKKKILLIIICILLLNTGCQKEEEYQQIEINEKKLITCLTNELGAYITSEISVDEEVSLNTYTTKKDKIDFYKSIKTDNNNIYAIVKSDEDEIIQDFNFYFSNNFKEYQTYSIHDYNIFIHNNKVDVNFSDLNKCYQTTNNDDIEIKDFNKELAEKLDNTNKVIVKSGDYELGILQNKDIINELLTAIKESKIYGENFLTDAPTIQLEMYNNTDAIEIINLYNDGYRLVPSNKGGYYTTTLI